MEKFEKIRIGEPDQNRVNKIVDLIDKIALIATDVKWGLDNLLNNIESVPLAYFFEFIKSTKPEDYLTQRFAEMKGISVPGLSIEKLIASKLIDIPKESVQQSLNDRLQFLKIINSLEQESYSVKLSEMFNEADNLFEIDPEILKNKVIEDLSIYTQSEMENMIVNKLENLFNSINDLVELEVLPCDSRCMNIQFLLNSMFEIDRREKRPVRISQQVFRNKKLSPFVADNKFRTVESFKLEKLLS